jgi:hypothetical protein
MNDNHYKNALDAAKKEMAELLPQHAAIEQRIAKLRQTIATLTALSEDTDEDDQVYVPSVFEMAATNAVTALAGLSGKNLALSDAVREVLKASGKPLTSVQVRDGLVRMGINLGKKYTSPLAVIHKALKRLHEKGEAKADADADGKTTYEWVAQNPRWLKHMKESGVVDLFPKKPIPEKHRTGKKD